MGGKRYVFPHHLRRNKKNRHERGLKTQLRVLESNLTKVENIQYHKEFLERKRDEKREKAREDLDAEIIAVEAAEEAAKVKAGAQKGQRQGKRQRGDNSSGSNAQPATQQKSLTGGEDNRGRKLVKAKRIPQVGGNATQGAVNGAAPTTKRAPEGQTEQPAAGKKKKQNNQQNSAQTNGAQQKPVAAAAAVAAAPPQGAGARKAKRQRQEPGEDVLPQDQPAQKKQKQTQQGKGKGGKGKGKAALAEETPSSPDVKSALKQSGVKRDPRLRRRKVHFEVSQKK